MPHDDVVHGAYYLVVHYVIRLLGSSNHALRLPSVLAMAVAFRSVDGDDFAVVDDGNAVRARVAAGCTR
jgi:hypothetical protein